MEPQLEAIRDQQKASWNKFSPGLKNISVKEVNGKLDTKTTDVYWEMMTEVGAPIVAALHMANDAIKDKIKKEVYQAVNQEYPDGNIVFDSSALVIYGEK